VLIDPTIVNEPVNVVLPTTLSSTAALLESVNEPVMVWLPTNVLDPVVANAVDGMPFNNVALVAQLAVPSKEEVTAPETCKDPVSTCALLEVNISFLFAAVSYPPTNSVTFLPLRALPMYKSLPVEYTYASLGPPITSE
jgi:hypothetical protein